MNRSLVWLALVGTLYWGNGVRCQDPDFSIFLCFGQSNMEGFPGIPDEDRGPVDPRIQVLAAVDFPELGRIKGKWYTAVPPLCRPGSGLSPADYFGRTLAANLPIDQRIGIVIVAVAGARIEVFDQDRLPAAAAEAPDWQKDIIDAYDGSPYLRLVELGRRAQVDGVIRGILMHQGESNADDPDWSTKVANIYSSLLRDLNLDPESVPLLVGELVAADQGGLCAGLNSTIASLHEKIPTAHAVSSEGCPCHSDQLHFSPVGYRELGRRYAETMLPLLGSKPTD